MIKLLINVLLYLLIFLIHIKPQKSMTDLFLKILFQLYVLDQYKAQQICDEAVDDCLAALKFVPDWFVTSKKLGKLDHALMA